ncbi:DUF4158 domain-containing protein [Streptomyces sp. NPDC059525]|uniref:DUF4158 domain-containing protein n=1 Tax=Streptomyces sp. NPDC059525 TaxID=3346857 RepID=UPI0036B11212
MTSIERTAYPRFKRLITAHELHLFFAPSRDEVEWAAARTDCDEHLLAQLLALKSYQRMGCFPKLDEIPDTVVDFVRRAVDLPEGTVLRVANRTAERQRTAVRQRTGLIYDKAKARKIAEAVMRSEAVWKNRPADLINIALEKVVEAGLELPGFTTLDALAAKVRTEVNASICIGVYDQLSEAHRERLLALLSEKDASGTTKYNKLKQSAKAPTWSHFRAQAEHLGWVDGLGETGVWLDGVASGKITDFAGEAGVADAPGLRDYNLVKRLALLSTRVRVRPQFEAALTLAREIKAHAPHCRVLFTVYEMKRLGRDAAELTALADHLTAHGLVLEMLAGPLPGIYDPSGPGRMLFGFFAAMAETERESIREATLEGLDAASRKGKHGGRPPVITDDMLHTVLRRRAAGESVEKIRPDLIIPTGRRKGQSPGLASIYRALAEHEKRQAYPEAVAQAHADFATLTQTQSS